MRGLDSSFKKTFFRTALPWVSSFALISVFVFAIIKITGETKSASGSSQYSSAATRVIADEATKTVHVVIDGKEVAVFDSKGLHVDGDVDVKGMVGYSIYHSPAGISSRGPRVPSHDSATASHGIAPAVAPSPPTSSVRKP